ncbi:MAG: S49 family peptidase [Burkholderiaceae bacterium]|nr:MAG: S49 family peptidase [Burkholderiaceae bacterium]
MASGDEIGLNSRSVPWERAAIEKLLLAGVKERRAARRWRMFKSVIWIALFAVLIWAFISDRSISNTAPGPHTAVVSIRGEIADDTDASAANILPAMRDALADSDTKALILLINSPGGSPVQAGLINDEIWRLRAKYKKPIYAVVEETCASAAYYIASAADQIFVNKASIVGSIGVLMNGFGFVDAMNKLGIERRLYTSGENKGFLDPFSPVTPQQREFAQSLLDDIHGQFIDAVKKGRGNRLKITPETFSGLFWTGDQAIKLGLADQLGSEDSVARDVVGASKLVDYTNKSSIAERFAKRLGAAIGAGAVHALGMVPTLR